MPRRSGLRRDGFASMDAGAAEGTLTTRPVTFHGKHLFVNVDAPQGELRVEVLDKDGREIRPFTRDNCVPLRADRTLQAVCWQGVNDLADVPHQLQETCPIQGEVANDHIVSGYEYSKGQYVVIDPDEEDELRNGDSEGLPSRPTKSSRIFS
jgi:hypothetical protein